MTEYQIRYFTALMESTLNGMDDSAYAPGTWQGDQIFLCKIIGEIVADPDIGRMLMKRFEDIASVKRRDRL